MARQQSSRPDSAFSETGFRSTVETLVRELARLYKQDRTPWVIGYSGGKDSSATLQLVWMALATVAEEDRSKPVHVITTDTMVENPIVSSWVAHSLERLNATAQELGLPIQANLLRPAVEDSFWVNLIGKGYPAPRPKFRWCTERLKIRPSTAFIRDVVNKDGDVVLFLGQRSSESAKRKAVMDGTQKVEDRADAHFTIRENSADNSMGRVATPIEDWSNDDVWSFLMQVPNPWGVRNKDLLTMYQGASEGGECPLVVDLTTPSCGDSRFGCWVCTLVDKDRSMTAMIQNDADKEWMLPLLELRDELATRDDRHMRDYRKMSGKLQVFKERLVHGPYKQQWRETWLRKVLEAQRWVREHGPSEVQNLELISEPELHEIRRIWLLEKHEMEDCLPRVYESVMGMPLPHLDDYQQPLGAEEIRLLEELCDGDRERFQLIRELLHIEHQQRTQVKRAGIQKKLEAAFRRHFFEDADDALAYALKEAQDREAVERVLHERQGDSFVSKPTQAPASEEVEEPLRLPFSS